MQLPVYGTSGLKALLAIALVTAMGAALAPQAGAKIAQVQALDARARTFQNQNAQVRIRVRVGFPACIIATSRAVIPRNRLYVKVFSRSQYRARTGKSAILAGEIHRAVRVYGRALTSRVVGPYVCGGSPLRGAAVSSQPMTLVFRMGQMRPGETYYVQPCFSRNTVPKAKNVSHASCAVYTFRYQPVGTAGPNLVLSGIAANQACYGGAQQSRLILTLRNTGRPAAMRQFQIRLTWQRLRSGRLIGRRYSTIHTVQGPRRPWRQLRTSVNASFDRAGAWGVTAHLDYRGALRPLGEVSRDNVFTWRRHRWMIVRIGRSCRGTAALDVYLGRVTLQRGCSGRTRVTRALIAVGSRGGLRPPVAAIQIRGEYLIQVNGKFVKRTPFVNYVRNVFNGRRTVVTTPVVIRHPPYAQRFTIFVTAQIHDPQNQLRDSNTRNHLAQGRFECAR